MDDMLSLQHNSCGAVRSNAFVCNFQLVRKIQWPFFFILLMHIYIYINIHRCVCARVHVHIQEHFNRNMESQGAFKEVNFCILSYVVPYSFRSFAIFAGDVIYCISIYRYYIQKYVSYTHA